MKLHSTLMLLSFPVVALSFPFFNGHQSVITSFQCHVTTIQGDTVGSLTISDSNQDPYEKRVGQNTCVSVPHAIKSGIIRRARSIFQRNNEAITKVSAEYERRTQECTGFFTLLLMSKAKAKACNADLAKIKKKKNELMTQIDAFDEDELVKKLSAINYQICISTQNRLFVGKKLYSKESKTPVNQAEIIPIITISRTDLVLPQFTLSPPRTQDAQKFVEAPIDLLDSSSEPINYERRPKIPNENHADLWLDCDITRG